MPEPKQTIFETREESGVQMFWADVNRHQDNLEKEVDQVEAWSFTHILLIYKQCVTCV